MKAPGLALFQGRYVILHDLDSAAFEPLALLLEQQDGSARLLVFEDAADRDPHTSKLRREFEDFEGAVATWSRSALVSTYGRVGTSLA